MTTEMRRWLEPVDTSFHAQGACVGLPLKEAVMFDPYDEDIETKPEAWERAAKAIATYCVSCPVLEQCRIEGDLHLYEGVHGGQFRERRGVIDLDTGMVYRDDYLLEPDPEPEPEPAVLIDFPIEPRQRGWPHYVLYGRDTLTAA